ncbi:60S ribosomal subunit assembly/export protein [Ascosphaera aggregata]|nr:60S ribosomal subunit assembly/export protein [Ascosphaera aggregata]
MAPNRGSTKASNKVGASKKDAKSSSSSTSKVSKKKTAKRPPPKEMKNKSRTAPEMLKRKKKREYTEKELNLPSLNQITPVGVTKPRGKKKGKIYVDDQESMMTILAMVNAEKEGQIESKMMKARQMEEIREARRKEAEARQAQKNAKLEAVKQSLKRSKKKQYGSGGGEGADISVGEGDKHDKSSTRKTRKSVSFV